MDILSISNRNGQISAEPGFVGYVYNYLMEKSNADAQISMAANIIHAIQPDLQINSYISHKYIDNKNFLKTMEPQDRAIFLYILDNFTKETTYYKKQEYQQAFQKVHHNTGSIVLTFGAKLYS